MLSKYRFVTMHCSPHSLLGAMTDKLSPSHQCLEAFLRPDIFLIR